MKNNPLTLCNKLFGGNIKRCCWEPADRSSGGCCATNFFRSPSLRLIRRDSNRHRGGVNDGDSDQLSLAVFFSFGVGGNGVVAILGNGRGHDIISLCSSSASVQKRSKSPSPALNLLYARIKFYTYKTITLIGVGSRARIALVGQVSRPSRLRERREIGFFKFFFCFVFQLISFEKKNRVALYRRR